LYDRLLSCQQRRDRDTAVGGGVCIFLSKKITLYAVLQVSDDLSEIVGVDIAYGDAKCYRPPQHNRFKLPFVDLVVCLKRVCSVSWHVTIAGDFNCPGIKWQLLEAPVDSIHDVLLDFACYGGFDQLVMQSTRESNILALVLTNRPSLFTNVSVEPLFGSSNHNFVSFDIDFTSDRAQT